MYLFLILGFVVGMCITMLILIIFEEKLIAFFHEKVIEAKIVEPVVSAPDRSTYETIIDNQSNEINRLNQLLFGGGLE